MRVNTYPSSEDIDVLDPEAMSLDVWGIICVYRRVDSQVNVHRDNQGFVQGESLDVLVRRFDETKTLKESRDNVSSRAKILESEN